MNQLEREIDLLQKEAQETQRLYPNAKTLPLYLETISNIVEKRKTELKELLAFIDSIQDQKANEIAWYRLIEGLTYREIATAMGYTPSHIQHLWKPYRDQLQGKNSQK